MKVKKIAKELGISLNSENEDILIEFLAYNESNNPLKHVWDIDGFICNSEGIKDLIYDELFRRLDRFVTKYYNPLMDECIEMIIHHFFQMGFYVKKEYIEECRIYQHFDEYLLFGNCVFHKNSIPDTIIGTIEYDLSDMLYELSNNNKFKQELIDKLTTYYNKMF